MKTTRESWEAAWDQESNWLASGQTYNANRLTGTTILVLGALVNLLDLLTTSMALANGYVETYPPSIAIISSFGFLGFSAAKVGFSLLLLLVAGFVWKSSDGMSEATSVAVLASSSVLLVAGLGAVINNLTFLV